MAFVTPRRGALAGARNSSMGPTVGDYQTLHLNKWRVQIWFL